MSKARDLLNKVIELIEKDLFFINEQVQEDKLGPAVAADLARYSGALLAITKDQDFEKESAKKELQKMSNVDLIRLAQDAARELDVRD